ncbi:STAS/SEC14 domain-containing protein [uncultured Sunxiuqinia sp.]|jgi:stage II sporulation SpoAA-like protein|uniref:STAS/SEC14 domain-containing protein n=1 Tax=uncultured Sunxiuqinia sp. TaxID=1573825 RepID=UPI0030DC8F21|tara:strand:- start:19364 stop:19720 length:357 start_codon:yes stop_codon:yes gene_type:complete
MFKLLNLTKDNLIAIKIDGKVRKEDYQMITPLINGRVKDYGKIRMYIEIESIEGVEAAALKEDLKTYIRHFNHMEKIAVVGKSKWQKLWSNLASPFISGEMKYYSEEEITDAVRWILD